MTNRLSRMTMRILYTCIFGVFVAAIGLHVHSFFQQSPAHATVQRMDVDLMDTKAPVVMPSEAPNVSPFVRQVQFVDSDTLRNEAVQTERAAGLLSGWVKSWKGTGVDRATVSIVSSTTQLGWPADAADVFHLEVQTDPRGWFEAAVEESGEFTVVAKKVGFAPASRRHVRANGPVNLVLAKAGEIFVIAKRERDGEPMANVPVRLVQASTGSVEQIVTDETGTARFADVVAGWSTIDVTPPPPLKRWSTQVWIQEGETRSLPVDLMAGLDVSGTVRGKPDGRPIADARVEVVDGFRMTRTDSSGNFVLNGVQAGDVVQVSASGFADLRSIVTQEASGAPARLDFPLVPGASLRGRVRSRRTGNLLANAQVISTWSFETEARVSQRWKHTTSDDSGAFELNHLPNVAQTVLVQCEGYAQVAYDVLPGDETLDLGDLSLSPAGSLSGIVLDATDKEVPHAKVRVRGSNGDRHRFHDVEPECRTLWPFVDLQRSLTDADGKFRFSGLAPGDYQVSARVGDANSGPSLPVTLGDGESRQGIILRLGAMDSVAGRVEGPDSTAVLATVIAMDSESSLGRSITDADGRFVIQGIPPHAHTLLVQPLQREIDADTRVGDRRVSIRPGDTDIVISLSSTVATRGWVMDREYRPIPGAVVVAHGCEASHAKSDESGEFTIYLPAGETADLEAIVESARYASGSTVNRANPHAFLVSSGDQGVVLHPARDRKRDELELSVALLSGEPGIQRALPATEAEGGPPWCRQDVVLEALGESDVLSTVTFQYNNSRSNWIVHIHGESFEATDRPVVRWRVPAAAQAIRVSPASQTAWEEPIPSPVSDDEVLWIPLRVHENR